MPQFRPPTLEEFPDPEPNPVDIDQRGVTRSHCCVARGQRRGHSSWRGDAPRDYRVSLMQKGSPFVAVPKTGTVGADKEVATSDGRRHIHLLRQRR